MACFIVPAVEAAVTTIIIWLISLFIKPPEGIVKNALLRKGYVTTNS